MASKATLQATSIRVCLIGAILEENERKGFRDLDHVLFWFLCYVGDGLIPACEQEIDRTLALAAHGSLLSVLVMIKTSRKSEHTVAQLIDILGSSQSLLLTQMQA